MTNMSTRQLQNFAYDCVVSYSKLDKFAKQYTIKVSDLPDFTQNEFASLFMSESTTNANEATGSDNGHYCTKMLPALLRYLKNSTSRDEEIEFVRSWKEGVTEYYHNQMQELLTEACYEYNESEGLLCSEDNGYRRESLKEMSIW